MSTLLETIVSFLFVAVIGTGLAVALWYFTELSKILEPYLVVLNSLPKSALAPLLIVWLGANQKSIIVSGMSVAIFGTVLNLFTGFQEVDPDKIRLIYTFGGTKRNVLTKVVLPGTLDVYKRQIITVEFPLWCTLHRRYRPHGRTRSCSAHTDAASICSTVCSDTRRLL